MRLQLAVLAKQLILIASSFVFRFCFCDRNHIPQAHAYNLLLISFKSLEVCL